MIEITEQQYQQAFDSMYDYEKEILDHNASILRSFAKRAVKDFKKLTENCSVVNKIEYVDEPKGDKQNENCGIFKDVHVDQYSTGDSGDSFAGHIYAKVYKNWIQVYYEC